MKNIEILKFAAKMVYSCEKAAPLRKKLLDFIINSNIKNLPEIKSLLKNTDPYLFYRVIALANDIENPFDERVVKAYWFGNDLLENIKREHIEKIVSDYCVIENPLIPALLLIKKLNLRGIILTHLIYVFNWFLAVKDSDDAIKKNKNEIENCQVSFGKVEVIKKEFRKATVSCGPLIFGGIILSDRVAMKEFSSELVVGLKIGDIVACHKGDIVSILDGSEADSLLNYTQRSLNLINSLKEK